MEFNSWYASGIPTNIWFDSIASDGFYSGLSISIGLAITFTSN